MTEHYKQYGESGYFVKLDIKKYFNSIDHSILKSKLESIVNDDKIRNLLFKIIDSYSFSDGCGLPMGNQSSQCFALLYLDSVDKYIKRTLKVKRYVRYMDDFILIVNGRNTADLCLKKIREEVEKLNISLNGKSQIIPIKNGISFLGWRFRFGENGKIVQSLKKDTRKRIMYKIKTKTHLFAIHKISKNKLYKSLVSYKGFCKSGMAKSFFYGIKNELF